MKATIAAAATLSLLAGCAPLSPPGYNPRYAHYHPPPRVYAYAGYAYPALQAALAPPPTATAPGAQPAPGPNSAPPPATAAASGPSLSSQRPQSDPYNPYTPEQMNRGIAEAVGLASLLSMGSGGPGGGGGGGGSPSSFIDPDAPGLYHTDPPEPYSCSWGYATLGTCVGPR